jgi:hypothetical protein
MASPVIPLTARIAQDQSHAPKAARAMMEKENQGSETRVEAQDFGREPGYVIYVYNILGLSHTVQQPPIFPGLIIPKCEKGQKFAYTILPAFVKEPYVKPGTVEHYFKNVDGRKAATSLLNPSAFPGTNWESQLQNWDTGDQFGNNLNLLGCFWSLTTPEETEKLEVEIKIFKEIATKTMNALVERAMAHAAAGELKNISPLHHFAMDYLGKQAPWHTTSRAMITCPNCGDVVPEGISYHRNSFGDKCIIDRERYEASIVSSERPTAEPNAQDSPRPAAKRRAAAKE